MTNEAHTHLLDAVRVDERHVEGDGVRRAARAGAGAVYVVAFHVNTFNNY